MQRAHLDLIEILKSQTERLGAPGGDVAGGASPTSMDGMFQAARAFQEAFLKPFADWADALTHYAVPYNGSAAPAAVRKPQLPEWHDAMRRAIQATPRYQVNQVRRDA